MRTTLLFILLAMGLGACREQAPRHPVERATLTGSTVVGNGLLGMDPPRIQALFLDTLRGSRHFTLLEEEKAPSAQSGWQLTLELPFTREALKDGSSAPYAEVGATLTLERREGERTQRYEVVGLGEVRVDREGEAARRDALREALRQALSQVATSASLQMVAAGRDDAALERDLKVPDERVREYALRVLAERRHPAAAPLLIRQLESEDPVVVRRAIGALVEMNATSAVPALIDLVKDSNMGFVQEIVFAIGEIGGEEAEAYLFTMAQGHDQPDVQAAAQQALDTLDASRKLGTPEARGQDRAEH
jgi:hypothetical protein